MSCPIKILLILDVFGYVLIITICNLLKNLFSALHCKTLAAYITSIEASNIGSASNIKSNHVSSCNVLWISLPCPSLDDAKVRSLIWLGDVAPSIAFTSFLAWRRKRNPIAIKIQPQTHDQRRCRLSMTAPNAVAIKLNFSIFLANDKIRRHLIQFFVWDIHGSICCCRESRRKFSLQDGPNDWGGACAIPYFIHHCRNPRTAISLDVGSLYWDKTPPSFVLAAISVSCTQMSESKNLFKISWHLRVRNQEGISVGCKKLFLSCVFSPRIDNVHFKIFCFWFLHA